MRLMLKTKCTGVNRIPVQYNNAFSSAIFKLMQQESPKLLPALENTGYGNNEEKFDLFCFALGLEKYSIDDHAINLAGSNVIIYISLPLVESFVQDSVLSILIQKELIIEDDLNSTSFSITQVDVFPEPRFEEEMKFVLLSPLVLTTEKEKNNLIKRNYLKPRDYDKINEVLTEDLLNKYSRIYDKDIECERLQLNFEKDYLSTHNGIVKKVTLKEEDGHHYEAFGIKAPFTLKGNPELIKVGYNCGFGEMNSLGFGLAVAKRSNNP